MSIDMLRRMLYTPVFHIDTNMINARGKLESMNQIERWAEEGVILVNISGVSFKVAESKSVIKRIFIIAPFVLFIMLIVGAVKELMQLGLLRWAVIVICFLSIFKFWEWIKD